MNKKELRKKYLNIRNNIQNKMILDNEIYMKVINNYKVKNSKLILIYVSTNSEVDTIKLITYFLGRVKVAVPKIENGWMNFYYINSLDELDIGKYGILEPTTNYKVNDFNDSVCITPGVCFSKNGYRIGYGGGFYDRFLSQYNVYAIGLSYKDTLVDNLILDEYDKKVDEIICNN